MLLGIDAFKKKKQTNQKTKTNMNIFPIMMVVRGLNEVNWETVLQDRIGSTIH